MSGSPNPKITDFTPMPIGKFEGTPMANVPAWHLLWYLEQPWLEEKYPALYEYIKSVEPILLKEQAKKKQRY